MDCLCIKGLSPTCNRAKLDSNGNLQVADVFMDSKYFQNTGAVNRGDAIAGYPIDGPFPADGEVISSLAIRYTNEFCRDVRYYTYGRFSNIGMTIPPNNDWSLSYGLVDGGFAGVARMTTFGFGAAQVHQWPGGWHLVSAGTLAPGATLSETVEVKAHLGVAATGSNKLINVGRLMYRIWVWSV